jgi:hypothetical protein
LQVIEDRERGSSISFKGETSQMTSLDVNIALIRKQKWIAEYQGSLFLIPTRRGKSIERWQENVKDLIGYIKYGRTRWSYNQNPRTRLYQEV